MHSKTLNISKIPINLHVILFAPATAEDHLWKCFVMIDYEPWITWGLTI